MRAIYLTAMGLAALLVLCVTGSVPAPRSVKWRKVVLDTEFRSEGVTVADVNRDGRQDVLAGLVWYEAPGWKMHELAPQVKYDAAGNYSDTFINFTADLNRDGWPDLIRLDWPGRDPAVWHENPKGRAVHWAEHRIAANACNESPYYGQISGAGADRKLIFALNDEQMVWLEPDKDPAAPFLTHAISEKLAKADAMS